MIDGVLDFIKILLYIVAFVELATLTHLYYYAYKSKKQSKVILNLAILLAVFTFTLFYRFLLSYTVFISINTHRIFRQGVIIPLLLTIVAARRFRKVSLEKQNGVEKELKKVAKPKK